MPIPEPCPHCSGKALYNSPRPCLIRPRPSIDWHNPPAATLPWSIPSHWEYSFHSSLVVVTGDTASAGALIGGLLSGTLPLALTIRRQLDFRGQTPGEAGTLGRNIGGALGGGSTGDTASKKTAWYIRDAAGGKHHETRNSICNEMMQICNT